MPRPALKSMVSCCLNDPARFRQRPVDLVAGNLLRSLVCFSHHLVFRFWVRGLFVDPLLMVGAANPYKNVHIVHYGCTANKWRVLISSECLEQRKLPALLFLASPVGCLAFGFEPCFDEGDGAAVGGNGVWRCEVGTVSGFGDRKVRAFGSYALDFEVRGVVTDVHAEPMRLITDSLHAADNHDLGPLIKFARA